MIFGDPNAFAIEAMTEPHLTPPSAVWGRVCVHAKGVTLGDISEPSCGLHAVYSEFDQLLQRLDELWDCDFAGLDDRAIYDHLDAAYYGVRDDEDPRSDAEIHEDAKRFWKFMFLTNWVESFDGWRAFLIRPAPGELRILYRRHADSVRGVLHVSTKDMRRAVSGFGHWYESEAARLEQNITG